MSFLANNLQNFWLPNGTDEYAYMGIARRMVIFENKEAILTPFQGSPLLYSYWLGIVHSLTNIPLETLTLLMHGFVLFLLIFLGYRLGQRFSKTTGLIVAILIGFSLSPQFFPGQAYMVPSHFLSLSLLLIIPLLLGRNRNRVFMVLLLCTLLFWWGILPLIAFILIYYFNPLSLKHLILSIGAFVLLKLMLTFQPFLDLSHFFLLVSNFSSSNTPDYLATLWSYFYIYLPALAGLIILYPKFSHSHFKSSIRIAISLLFTSFFFYIILGTHIHTRMFFLFFLSCFLLIGIGYDYSNATIKNSLLKKSLPFLLVCYFIFAFYRAGYTYATDIAVIPTMIPSEVSAFEWIEKQDVSNDLLISDYATIFTSMFHVNTLNSNYFQNKAPKNWSDEEASLHSYLNLRSPQMKTIYSIFSDPFFSTESIDFLTESQQIFKADKLFVIISPRTREAIARFAESEKPKTHDSRVIMRAKDYDFVGEGKFSTSALFEIIYDNGETQIYQYNP